MQLGYVRSLEEENVLIRLTTCRFLFFENIVLVIIFNISNNVINGDKTGFQSKADHSRMYVFSYARLTFCPCDLDVDA